VSKPAYYDWDAVRRGPIFCSPACGGRCTWAAHLAATAAADKLAREMGPGWTPHVWENLGWHYSVLSPCRRLKIHPGGGTFTAFLGSAASSGGVFAETARTPRAAIAAVRARAAAQLAESIAMLEACDQ